MKKILNWIQRHWVNLFIAIPCIVAFLYALAVPAIYRQYNGLDWSNVHGPISYLDEKAPALTLVLDSFIQHETNLANAEGNGLHYYPKPEITKCNFLRRMTGGTLIKEWGEGELANPSSSSSRDLLHYLIKYYNIEVAAEYYMEGTFTFNDSTMHIKRRAHAIAFYFWPYSIKVWDDDMELYPIAEHSN